MKLDRFYKVEFNLEYPPPLPYGKLAPENDPSKIFPGKRSRVGFLPRKTGFHVEMSEKYFIRIVHRWENPTLVCDAGDSAL